MPYHKQAPKKKTHRQHSIGIDLNTVNGITEQFITTKKLMPAHKRLLSQLWRV